MSIRNLDSLFRPASIALIGASDREGSVGNVIWRNLRQGGFKGDIWPVNSRAQTLDGVETFRGVDALPAAPGLAVICTPAGTVPALIDALGKRGTRAAIVITAGLRTSLPEGGTIEQAMLDAARPHLLRILGPNCIGALVPGCGLNASFAPGQALPGPLAFVTQSGALATAMLDWANGHGIGFSHFVSLGDSADVDFGDMLDLLGSDADTRAILMYVESVKHARKFMSAARAAARNKPVILVKAGRAPGGAKAAASHTGALAGSDVVFDAAVRRAGMLRVDTLEALFDAAETLSRPRAWRGSRLAILTNGGGAGVLAADALSLCGGTLAELQDATLAALDAVLPATWSRGNPIDIIGDAPVERYDDALKILLAAPEVDGVLFMHAPTAIVPAQAIAEVCIPAMREAAKPVLTCWVGGPAVKAARELAGAAGLPGFGTPEHAIAAWMQMQRHHESQQALLQLPDAGSQGLVVDREAARAVLDRALAQGLEWLEAADSMAVLRAYGIEAVRSVKASDPEDVVSAAHDIGFPVALKIVSKKIIHKSDVGGVALNIRSADELRRAMVEMRQRVAARSPGSGVLGFTVQAMASRPGAHELIAGIATDPVFGPVVMFGEGGTGVELRRDTAVALPPLNEVLARELVGRTQVGRLLAGYRGAAGVDEKAVTGTLIRLAQIAADLPQVAELDINPLLADAQGVLAVDARIRVRKPVPGERGRLALRPYPADLEETFTLEGRALRVRPIRPEDGARLHAFYEAATAGDMRLRFFMARREIPPSELARYCQIDYEREMTFVALDGDHMAAEVRAVCDPDNIQAEFAIQVATAWQARGLGRLMLAKMIAYLRARGTAEMIGSCLQENSGMASLARHAGFEITDRGEGAVSLRLRLAAA